MGCSATIGDSSFSFGQLPEGDDAQTLAVTTVGANVAPAGQGGPQVFVGYQHVSTLRVPAYDADAQIPCVVQEVRVDAQTGVKIGEGTRVHSGPCPGAQEPVTGPSMFFFSND